MKEKTDILVIGGSAAGLVAGMTAKGDHKEKRVLMIRREEQVMIPCGIPYIFGSLEGSEQNILPDGGLKKLGVNIVTDNVQSIDTKAHEVRTESGSPMSV